MTFHGKPRFDQHVMDHVHESPLWMTGPLMVLSVGALFAGMLLHNSFIGPDWQNYWGLSIFNAPHNHVMHDMEEVPEWAALLPLLLGIGGIAMAYWWYMFNPAIPARLAARFPGVYQFLLNKWYFDELYDRIFVQPTIPPVARVVACRRCRDHRRDAERRRRARRRWFAPGGQAADRVARRSMPLSC